MMDRHTEYLVEWVEEREMLSDYPAAARKGGYSEQDIKGRQDFLDVCPAENYMHQRKFPSLEMAKGWALKNRKRDLWKDPRVIVREVTPATYHEPEEWEDIEVWKLDDGDMFTVDPCAV